MSATCAEVKERWRHTNNKFAKRLNWTKIWRPWVEILTPQPYRPTRLPRRPRNRQPGVLREFEPLYGVNRRQTVLTDRRDITRLFNAVARNDNVDVKSGRRYIIWRVVRHLHNNLSNFITQRIRSATRSSFYVLHRHPLHSSTIQFGQGKTIIIWLFKV